MKHIRVVSLCVLASVVPVLRAQTAAAPVDPSAVWKALQAPAMDPAKTATVENIEIVRDRVHITLVKGTIQFAQPANGVVFGAAFRGEGRVRCEPPNPIEAQQLRLFTKQDKLDMTFTEATFSFADDFFDEVAKQVKWAPGGGGDNLYVNRQQERENLGGSNLPRLFQSVLSPGRTQTAFFLADLKTAEKGWVEIFDDALDEEDITVGRWVGFGYLKGFDTWMSFPAGGRTSADAWKDPQAKADFLIRSYKIDVTVTSGAELSADARVTIEPRLAGQRVLLFDLDSNLRVESVTDGQGKTLSFYQARENKDRWQSYGNYVAVILPEPFQQGPMQTLGFRYGGKRAIRKVGDLNFFCESSGWYPARPDSFAARADFELTFHNPKHLALVATGLKKGETTAEKVTTTNWKSEIPLAVAGFAFGDYRVYNEKANAINVDVYANREPDDVMRWVQQHTDVGDLTPAAFAKTMGIEMANTLLLFEAYYGPYPYTHFAVTSLPITFSYGQGWPGLIYLWSGSFLDVTQRHAIFGFVDETQLSDFFRAHEASHQWWGHRVGWKSYHDQWLSEGFANFSGILYVQYRQNWKEAKTQWRLQKEILHSKDEKSHTVETLGPIWLGRRIASSETDRRSYQKLIYSKGAYVLQMLRMMLYDTRNPDPDHLFKDMMQDYCKTFDNKPASTEDFKAMVEKHMLPSMDLDGNHRMDWFFNEYVYGTGIPQYSFTSAAGPTPDGKTHIYLTFTRTGVPDNWKDAVPVYAHAGDKMFRLGIVRVSQPNQTVEATVPATFNRVTINDFEDLLADVK
jgi:Peptidase family M1 domain